MRAFPIVLLFVIAAGPLAAQEPNPLSLTVGDQIRVPGPGKASEGAEGYMMARTAPVGGWMNGQVTMLGTDGFSFTVDGDPRIYTQPYATIDMIDVKRRVRRDSVKSGVLWGVYLGAALGMISGPLAAKSMPIETGTLMAVFGAGGALGGALLGAATGAVRVPSRWYRHVFR